MIRFRSLPRTLRALAAVAVLALFAAPAFAATELTMEIEEASAGGEATYSGKMLLDGQRLLMDSRIGAEGQAANTVIFRGDLGEMWIVDHQRREAMMMDRETMEQLAGQIRQAREQMEQAMANVPPGQREMMEKMMKGRMSDMPGMEPKEPVELTRTGETGETADGWAWEKVEAWRGGVKVAEYLVTDLSELDLDEEDFAAFEGMQQFFQEMIESIGMEIPTESPFGEVADLGGFPVISRTYSESGQLESTTRLRSTSDVDADEGDFTPPADYAKRDLAPQR